MPSETSTTLGLDSLFLTEVNCHDIWDRRESAVANSDIWKAACEQYKSTANFQAGIPHHLHQVWIGTRQPPCVWLDTWRLDFMSAFEVPTTTSPTQQPWSYTLWDNASVKHMPMINRDLFDAESAPQCQADILRLEVLYEYGGVYIDADIVSTVRDLRPALESARETGFLITYEPDTKDKPYSILGNSLIACTPKHPLILMLMAYIKQIYHHKRAHYGVEWVTGPLTYTKVLMHTDMPVTVPPSKDFYPAFHYVPNPSSIDVTTFDSYCFQFGYTCSGLSQWVAENNKCRRAHDCNHHANVDYPLGKLRQFPTTLPATRTNAQIPKAIHQISFQAESGLPKRWTDTWQKNFCPTNGFQYELWTWKRLREEIGSFYCANLYEEGRMDAFSLHMLVLEILQARGGYYVPLSTVFVGDSANPEVADQIFGTGNEGRVRSGSIVGYASSGCLNELKKCYDSGKVMPGSEISPKAPSHPVSDMGFGDDIAAFVNFKDTSRFLGASEMYYLPAGDSDRKVMSAAGASLLWAYDCQVPIFRFPSDDSAIQALNASGKRSIVITDSALGAYPSLVNEIPGVMYQLDEQGVDWDYIVLNVEWEVDEDGLAVYKACSPFRAPNAHYLGFIANVNASREVKSGNIETILEKHDTGRVYVASEKSRHSAKLSSIFKAMPAVEHVCRSLADFEPNFGREHDEAVDGLLKGYRGGQVGFEMQVDREQVVMFRSWGSEGQVDCECKISPGMSGISVEYLRIYQGQGVTFETSETFVR